MSDTIELSIRWDEEGDPFLYEEDDTEGTADAFRVQASADLWRKLSEADGARADIWRSLVKSVDQGIDLDQQRLTSPCAEWKGDVTPRRVFWDVVLPESGDENTWPLLPVRVGYFDTEPEARAHIASLPELFAIHPSYAPRQGLPMVTRASLRVERGEYRERVSACDTCGWERADHA